MLQVVLRCAAIALAVSLAAPMALAEEGPAAKPRLLASFEPGEREIVQGPGKIVHEQATDGQFSLRLENPGHGYVALSITDPATLRWRCRVCRCAAGFIRSKPRTRSRDAASASALRNWSRLSLPT